MSASEKTTSQAQGPPDHDEFAGAKLWAVYISEAENYDKALVESWKSDMEGLLIFAGLFSASLTAFLIESYKTLNADQGTITIAVLTQISLQLDTHSNASAVNIPSLEAFTPTPASLACNILWFLSLWASLSCALIATLVQQWARDFIQRTEMRPSPIVRARIFSYLYFGLRRFGMHKAVEFIPLLLHVSLLLFFAGLVAFLIPVHRVLTIMTAVLLVLTTAAYAYLTVLPIFSSDSPYRTPLSNLVWRSFRCFDALWHLPRQSSSDEESTLTDERSSIPAKTIPTMVEIMTRDAIEKSNKRDERDARAIVWTVQSLADDNELEPFVEALPDLIWGPTGRRTAHDDMIKLLLDTRDLRLVSRIEGLLRSCDTGVLPRDREAHRRISCIKALWAIAYFSASNISTRLSFPVFDQQLLASRLNAGAEAPVVNSHLTSAYSIVRWSGFCSLSSLVRDTISALENTLPLKDLRSLLKTIQSEAQNRGYTELSGVLSSLITDQLVEIPVLIQRSHDALFSFQDVACDILTEYLLSSARLETEPYEFEATCLIMVPRSTEVQTKLRDTFITMIDENYSTLKAHETFHHIDHVVHLILRVLQPHPEFFDAGLARAFVTYLWVRGNENAAVTRTLEQCNPKFIGSLLTKYLAHDASCLTGGTPQEFRARTVYGILRLCWCNLPRWVVFDEETLALVVTEPRFLVSSCAAALIKSRILMDAAGLPPNELDALMIRLQIPHPDVSDKFKLGGPRERWREGFFALVVEFLEQSDGLAVADDWNKQQAVRTFDFLVGSHPWGRVSPSLQFRLATWFFNVVHAPSVHTYLINAIIGRRNRFLLTSIDDRVARTTICAALTTYGSTPSDGDEKPMQMLRRINELLVILDSPAYEIDEGLPESAEIILGGDTSTREVYASSHLYVGAYES
ncbi:hypothetical protein C8R44DRAFT_978053 [Mycena epipterygia]|nr:hypothetical protein C8R44DRAFT_978053 [Mycena epipterygia]